MLPVKSGPPCQVNISFGLPCEVQQILQELLILNHPKLLELEEGLQKQWVGLELGAKPAKLFLVLLVCTQELVFDLADFFERLLVQLAFFL